MFLKSEGFKITKVTASSRTRFKRLVSENDYQIMKNLNNKKEETKTYEIRFSKIKHFNAQIVCIYGCLHQKNC